MNSDRDRKAGQRLGVGKSQENDGGRERRWRVPGWAPNKGNETQFHENGCDLATLRPECSSIPSRPTWAGQGLWGLWGLPWGASGLKVAGLGTTWGRARCGSCSGAASGGIWGGQIWQPCSLAAPAPVALACSLASAGRVVSASFGILDNWRSTCAGPASMLLLRDAQTYLGAFTSQDTLGRCFARKMLGKDMGKAWKRLGCAWLRLGCLAISFAKRLRASGPVLWRLMVVNGLTWSYMHYANVDKTI